MRVSTVMSSNGQEILNQAAAYLSYRYCDHEREAVQLISALRMRVCADDALGKAVGAIREREAANG